MSKLIELGVVSEDTRQTSPGFVYDGRVDPSPIPGMCLHFKIFNPAGTGPDLLPCGT